MSHDRYLRVHSPEFTGMSARVIVAMTPTSQVNGLTFGGEAGKAEVFEQILGRPVPDRTAIYVPFYTDRGLNLELGERVFIN